MPRHQLPEHTVDVSIGKSHYYKHTKTKAGYKRYRCKQCGKTFTAPNDKPTHRQRAAYKNKTIFKLLTNKSPITRITEIAEVGKQTIYDKIEFLHSQCLAFICDRERRLLPKLDIERLYLNTDRQNWTDTHDKRNVILKAIATVNMRSNYIFGIHVYYDDRLSPEFVALASK
jgi:transposase-like protein